MEPGSRRGETNLYHWQSRSSSTFSLPLCVQVFSRMGYSNNPLLAPSLLPSSIWNAFLAGVAVVLLHERIERKLQRRLRSSERDRHTGVAAGSSSVHTNKLNMHTAAQTRVGWGRIWDERSTAVPLSSTGGVFSQLKSNRLADFHSSL